MVAIYDEWCVQYVRERCGVYTVVGCCLFHGGCKLVQVKGREGEQRWVNL